MQFLGREISWDREHFQSINEALHTYLVATVKEMIALIHKLLDTLPNMEIAVLKDGIKG